MKKNILLSSIVIVLILIGFVTYQYFNSFKEVSFLVKQTDLTIDIFKVNKDNSQKINSFSGDTKLSLQNGNYYYVANGKKVDSSHHTFSLTSTVKTITIDPDYSSAYLAGVLAAENTTIQTVISAAYPTVIKQYDIFSSQLFQKGEWYGGVLKYRTSDPNEMRDPYRIIMHFENNKWVIVHYPEIVVTKTNYPTVPVEILNAVNTLLDS
jgi:hypothetical protein